MKLKIDTLIFLVFLCYLFSCNDNLTRDDAAKLIIEKYRLPSIKIGYTGVKGDYYEGFGNKKLEKAKELGLLTYEIKKWGWFGQNATYEANFTDLGNKFLVGEVYKTGNDWQGNLEYRIKVKEAIISLKEITGIVQDKKLKQAQVEFTLSISELTPFGIANFIEEGSYPQKCYFTKYDDGWRIDENCEINLK